MLAPQNRSAVNALPDPDAAAESMRRNNRGQLLRLFASITEAKLSWRMAQHTRWQKMTSLPKLRVPSSHLATLQRTVWRFAKFNLAADALSIFSESAGLKTPENTFLALSCKDSLYRDQPARAHRQLLSSV
jgi:hypothetical protein